jgi:two-component system, NtrC family, nitrogen regulation sensor histidine kinase NtrY
MTRPNRPPTRLKSPLRTTRLQVRMVGLFAILAATPAVLLVIFSTLFFQIGLQTWFSGPVRDAVHEASAVAEAYLDEHRKVIQSDMQAMATDIDRQFALLYGDTDDLQHMMDTQSFLRNFNESALFDEQGRVMARGGLGMGFDPGDLPPATLQTARLGDAVVYTNQEDDEKIQAVAALPNTPDIYLYVARAVDPKVLSYLAATRDATQNYQALEARQGALRDQFVGVYLAITILLLGLAVWGGLYVSRKLTRPVDRLIVAAERVRLGDLSAQVGDQHGIDEFDELARSFNLMTHSLLMQRQDLIAANHQLDTRRHLIEMILAGVSSGVMALSPELTIRSINEQGARILGLGADQVEGRPLRAILPDWGADRAHEHEINYTRPDHQRRTLLVRQAPAGSGSADEDRVLTFDDITELKSAERKSAWADVARRVAHEIKNPLTPIQLSAERLRRRFGKNLVGEDQAVFQQCVDTIIRHVGDIGRMVAEFAQFARMPEPILQVEDLQDLIDELTTLHAHHAAQIKLTKSGFEGVCPVVMDAAQMRQALTNLILNALESVAARLQEQPNPPGVVHVDLTRNQGNYILSVLDNGLGFPKGVAAERLSEPYVTFKEKGTGLGLAIVKKIVADHKGSVILGGANNVRERNHWGDVGAVVSVVLPIPLEQNVTLVENRTHAA